MVDWMTPEDREYFHAAEEQYLKWCEEHGVEPYICGINGCDRRIPCRKHPPEIWSEES